MNSPSSGMMEEVTGGGGGQVEQEGPSPSPKLVSMDEFIRRLPPEIWGIILANLKGDSESLLTCAGMCQTWKELLDKDRVDWLFPLVIPVLEKYLSGNEMLACRLVSKTWKDGVDKYRQKCVQGWTPLFGDDMINTVKSLGIGGHERGSYQGRNVFTRKEQMDRLEQQMRDQPGINPFPSKSLIYRSFVLWQRLFLPIIVTGAQEMETSLGKLLTTSGQHVEDFTYITGNVIFGGLYAVPAILHRLPNLRSFFVHHSHSLMLPLPLPPGSYYLKPNMPALRYLRSLHLSTEHMHLAIVDELAKTFNSLLVAYGRQLEQLEVDSEVFFTTNYLNPCLKFSNQATTIVGQITIFGNKSDKFISLKRLKIRNIQRKWSFAPLQHKLLNLDLPHLEQVSLHFHSNGSKIELWRLIELLNRWSPTLKEVHFLVERPQLEMYSPFYSDKNAARVQMAAEEKLQLVQVFGACYSLLDTPVLMWLLNKFPKLKRLELHGYNNATSQRDLMFGNRRNHQEMIDDLWAVAPTMTDIVVWDSVMPASAPKQKFLWKRKAVEEKVLKKEKEE